MITAKHTKEKKSGQLIKAHKRADEINDKKTKLFYSNIINKCINRKNGEGDSSFFPSLCRCLAPQFGTSFQTVR